MNVKPKYGDCTICGGRVSEKLVEKVCSRGGRLIAVVRGVPAGVCDQCGERYYKAPVLKHINELLDETHRKPRYINVPITDYAA